MTDYEKCAFIRRHMMNRVSALVLYNTESDVAGNLKAFAALLKEESGILPIDITQLSRDQMVDLGFSKWDVGGLMLIPGWLCIFLPPELEVICIDGTTVAMSHTYTELRFGCLAYGIMPATKPQPGMSDRLIEPNL